MKETINIKRKEFVVLEHIGENSFKVERKGKIYFLKQYQRRDDFNDFVKNSHRLKITAIDIPKVYMFDKDKMISVVDFIEGEKVIDIMLKNEPLDEEIYKGLMLDEWYARRERIRIELAPDQFIFNGKKLYYYSYEVGEVEKDYNFVMKDLKLWFMTKEFVRYAANKGIKVDEKLIGNEYATNKQMALMAVKYYQ